MNSTAGLLLLPRLRVQNANAMSGPLSWGFPAPTAFTGFAHALERHLRPRFNLSLGGVGIVCHDFEAQVFHPAGRYNQVLRLTRNPLDDKGGSAPIVEEGRCHMEVSLLIEVHTDLDDDAREALTQAAHEATSAMRLAGGSILPRWGKRYEPEWITWYDDAEDSANAFRKLRYRLLPGFALVQRDDILAARLAELRHATQDQDCDALDALLDLIRTNHEPAGPDPRHPEKTLWHKVRRAPGWLVPLPAGYAALSPLYPAGTVRNARDQQTPFRFVESVYTLGEWVSPHRMTHLQQLLWHLEAEPAAGLYRCTNRYPAPI